MRQILVGVLVTVTMLVVLWPKHPDRTPRKECGFCVRDARIAELEAEIKYWEDRMDVCIRCGGEMELPTAGDYKRERDEARRMFTRLVNDLREYAYTDYAKTLAQTEIDKAESWEAEQ